MVLLRDEDEHVKERIKDRLKAVYSLLLDCETWMSEEYIAEMIDKITANMKHDEERRLMKQLREVDGRNDEVSIRIRTELRSIINQLKHKDIPNGILRGDILYVKYGIGYGDELRKGHYGIILARRGDLYLVAPLTKRVQPYGELNITFFGLGLPGEDSSGKSYISFNHIRFVHKRRLDKIQGIKSGKIRILDGTVLENIMDNYFALIKSSPV